MNKDFLPMTREELSARGCEQPDFVYISGDAYVDHPSFGPALLCRLLEARGYTVGLICQPDWKKPGEHSDLWGTAPGIPHQQRQYGFHGQSLYGGRKTPEHRMPIRRAARSANGRIMQSSCTAIWCAGYIAMRPLSSAASRLPFAGWAIMTTGPIR